MLVHGPAGVGKTFAVATVLREFSASLSEGKSANEESKASHLLNVIRLTPADLINAPKNENQMIKQAFEDAVSKQPSVLWIEEVDYIAKSKGMFYSFLSSLDSFECCQSLVIATTSKLADVDKALRRGGRLDLDVVFEMPTP